MNMESDRIVSQSEPLPEVPTRAENFSAETDLASRWLGGSVIAANDESFGEKENLLTPTPAAFQPGHYGHRGEIVDGWETKRRREPGHDWAIIRLGAAGVISAIDVDTSFFTGNYPQFCRIEACGVEGFPSLQDLQAPSTEWIEIVPRSPLRGDAHNRLAVADRRRFTHVRLSALPDGGIARLRVFGVIVPDPRLFDGLTIDLASQDHGGVVVSSSDGFYTSAAVLNRPDKARTMGEGWETRRCRDGSNDHAIIKLALPGHIRLVEIDTAHFKYNASAEIALYGSSGDAIPAAGDSGWAPLLSRSSLQPDTRHVFPLEPNGPLLSAVRLDAFPDGGISRVRLWGGVAPAARRLAGYRWFAALPDNQALDVLAALGAAPDLAEKIAADRPTSNRDISAYLGDAVKSPAKEEPFLERLRSVLEGTT
jgi:allantoicase